jgi:predicted ATP-grasp superfamily ATP-dependent carboligase
MINLFDKVINKNTSGRRQICIATFARSWNALAATRCLGKNGVEVITGDDSMICSSNFSVHSKKFFTYPNPDKNPEGFIAKLVEVCIKYSGPDVDLVLMPLLTDAFLVARHAERFAGIAKLALPSRAQIDLLGNKASLAKYCEENGLRTPKTIPATSEEHLKELCETFPFPAFIKLPDACSAIGLKKVANPAEAMDFYKSVTSKYPLPAGEYPIIQQSVDGEDYCCTFIFDHGKRRASMTYHNILDFPRKSGMGAVRETVDAAEMEREGAKLLELAGWHGVAEIDFRWDGTDAPYLIEVNPRFWGGLAQSVESGWDYPYWLYRLAVDGTIPEMNPESHDVKTFNPYLLTLILLQEFVNTRKNPIQDITQALQLFGKDARTDLVKASGQLFKDITDVPASRLRAVEEILHANKGAVGEIFKLKDPLPVLGLLYPLTVFLKNGKISPELLVSKPGNEQKN